MRGTRSNRRRAASPRRWSISLIALLLVAGSRPAAQQAATRPRGGCEEPERLLAPGCRSLELTGLYFVESWNFNGRPRDFLEGGAAAVSVAVHDGWGAMLELVGTRVAQRSPAFVGGVSGLLRRRLAERRQMTFFVEGGFGVSYATLVVPEHGTRFNYLLQGGGGATRRLTRHTSFILDLRLFHLSNNSLNGSDHNPDIQSLGGHAGVLVWF